MDGRNTSGERAMQSETPTIKRIQMRASEMGGRLFRNTVGNFLNPKGGWVSVGLCEGSHDLIGFLPLNIGECTLPIFTAIEVKAGSTATTQQQKKFEQQFRKS